MRVGEVVREDEHRREVGRGVRHGGELDRERRQVGILREEQETVGSLLDQLESTKSSTTAFRLSESVGIVGAVRVESADDDGRRVGAVVEKQMVLVSQCGPLVTQRDAIGEDERLDSRRRI